MKTLIQATLSLVKKNPTRDPALAPAAKQNSQHILVPAIGLTYQLNDDIVLLAGVQKGYSPAAPSNASAEEEESINYETGLRLNSGNLSAEAIYFLSDYSNMHGNCTIAQGCDEDFVGDQYNAGETEVSGLELTLSYQAQTNGYQLPVTLSYTYTEFQNAHKSAVWGEVEVGDSIPYIADNQLSLSAGVIKDHLSVNFQGRYTDEMKTQAGSTDEMIASHTVQIGYTINF
ncbi:MAG: TonB-dependent receptor [Gammaproteobacteria bacterium]|nr:TonB-dependent receptor [Gammaproteobacteria bacterium]